MIPRATLKSTFVFHPRYVEEIYETFQEGEILGEEVTEDVDQSTTEEPDFLDTGNNSSPMATSGSSEELTTQQETTGNKSCNTLNPYCSLTKHRRKKS